MEILLILVAWPFLLLAGGLVFVGIADTVIGGSSDGYIGALVLYALISFVVFVGVLGGQSAARKKSPEDAAASMRKMKGDVYLMSIALLLPMFVRYVVEAFEKTLPAALLGLAVAFGAIFAGMAIKGNRVLSYSSIVGGTISLMFLFALLWDLGEGARIVASAVALVVAVGFSVFKFKDKLV